MTLRLVLVSLVAAMGLTVPSAPVIESWVASTQNWMNARFADWDTRCPQTADYVIVSDYYDVGPVARRPAISSRPVTAPELHLKNEGIGVVPPEMVRKHAAPVRLDPMPSVRTVYRDAQLELARWSRILVSVFPRAVFPTFSPRRIEPIVTAKKPNGHVADRLILLGQGFGINPIVAGAPQSAVRGPARPAVINPAPPALVSQTGFGPMETSATLYFAGALTPLAKNSPPTGPMASKLPSATPVAVSLPLPPAATETRDYCDDLDIEVAGELVRQDDGFGAPVPARMARVIAATPRFEPLDVECDYYVGTAYELNFRNDGLNLPAEAVHTAKTDLPTPESAREISRAVKLTRDAVYAWVNIFTGPALVTVSQSN